MEERLVRPWWQPGGHCLHCRANRRREITPLRVGAFRCVVRPSCRRWPDARRTRTVRFTPGVTKTPCTVEHAVRPVPRACPRQIVCAIVGEIGHSGWTRRVAERRLAIMSRGTAMTRREFMTLHSARPVSCLDLAHISVASITAGASRLCGIARQVCMMCKKHLERVILQAGPALPAWIIGNL